MYVCVSVSNDADRCNGCESEEIFCWTRLCKIAETISVERPAVLFERSVNCRR